MTRNELIALAKEAIACDCHACDPDLFLPLFFIKNKKVVSAVRNDLKGLLKILET